MYNFRIYIAFVFVQVFRHLFSFVSIKYLVSFMYFIFRLYSSAYLTDYMLYFQAICHVIILIGACCRVVLPLKASLIKRSKKKKSPPVLVSIAPFCLQRWSAYCFLHRPLLTNFAIIKSRMADLWSF